MHKKYFIIIVCNIFLYIFGRIAGLAYYFFYDSTVYVRPLYKSVNLLYYVSVRTCVF